MVNITNNRKYAVRKTLTVSVVEYVINERTDDGFILEDRSCQHAGDNCLIKIDNNLKFVCTLNESAHEHESFHIDNVFFATEKEAKRNMYMHYITMMDKYINEETTRMDIVKNTVEFLKKKSNTKINNTFEFGCDSIIYTVNENKIRATLADIRKTTDFDVNTLSSLVDEFKINYMKQTRTRRNGIETCDTCYYVDNRTSIDSCDENEMFFEVRTNDSGVIVDAERDYDDIDELVCFCNGYYFYNHRAYKTKGQCLAAICKFLLDELKKYNDISQRYIDTRTEIKNEYVRKLSILEEE